MDTQTTTPQDTLANIQEDLQLAMDEVTNMEQSEHFTVDSLENTLCSLEEIIRHSEDALAQAKSLMQDYDEWVDQQS